MITTLIIIVSGILTQTPSAFYGAVPKDVPTYTVTLPTGEQIRAGLRLRDAWVTDSAPTFDSGLRPTLVYDTPWFPRPEETAPIRKVQYTRVTQSIREAELKKGWKDAGYIFVETAAGEVPVLEAERDLAKRADALASPPVATGDAQTELASIATTTEQPVGNSTRWVGHALIVVLGLVVTGLIVKFFVLEDDWKKV